MSLAFLILLILLTTSLVSIVVGIVALQEIQKRNLAGKGRAVFAIITGAFYVLMLVGIGISNLGGGRSYDREARTNREMEERHRNEMRVQEIQRESQIQQARSRANAEIEKKRQEIENQKIRNSINMTRADAAGEAQLLGLELQQFKNRIELEFLTTYGETLDPR